MTKSDYSYSQLESMQQDAIRRVNDMWRQSREKITETERALGNRTSENEQKKKQPQASRNEECGCNEDNKNEINPLSPFTGIIQRMGLDDETVILLMMLLLLVNEGADVKLIMALVYIML